MDQKTNQKEGGRWVDENGKANECCNFLSGEDGIVYGYVATWRGGNDTKISIEKFGTTIFRQNANDYVDDIEVIWTATHRDGGRRVVGWYRNATIYRKRKNHASYPTEQHRKDKVKSYRIKARCENVHLVAENDRNLRLGSGSGWPGENSLFYPENHIGANADLGFLLSQLETVLAGDDYAPRADLSVVAYPDEITDNNYIEGATRSVTVNAYERSHKARQACIDHWGSKCYVCSLDFGVTYGEIGEGFIHVHHIKEFSDIGEAYEVNPVTDLRPLCPNCHAMIHRKQPAMDPDDLKRLFQRKKGKRKAAKV